MNEVPPHIVSPNFRTFSVNVNVLVVDGLSKSLLGTAAKRESGFYEFNFKKFGIFNAAGHFQRFDP